MRRSRKGEVDTQDDCQSHQLIFQHRNTRTSLIISQAMIVEVLISGCELLSAYFLILVGAAKGIVQSGLTQCKGLLKEYPALVGRVGQDNRCPEKRMV